MSEINRFIHNIVTNTLGITSNTIIELLYEKFQLLPEQEKLTYLKYKEQYGIRDESELGKRGKFTDISYVLSEMVKHPGIDIKIQGGDSTNYKIFIMGVRDTMQMSQIIKFLKHLLTLFKNYDEIYKNELFKDLIDSEALDVEKEKLLELEYNKKELKVKGADWLKVIDTDDLFNLEEDDEEPTIDATTEVTSEAEAEVASDAGTTSSIKSAKKHGNKYFIDYTKDIKVLNILYAYAPDVFNIADDKKGKGYASQCQSDRQPLVMSTVEYDDKMQEITHMKQQNAKKLKDAKGNKEEENNLLDEKKEIEYAEKILKGNSVNYKDNVYFCPYGYDFENKQIITPEKIERLKKVYKEKMPKSIYDRKKQSDFA